MSPSPVQPSWGLQWPATIVRIKTEFCHRICTSFIVWILLSSYSVLPAPFFSLARTLVLSYSAPWCHRAFACVPSAWSMLPILLHLVFSCLSFSSQLNCNLSKEIFLHLSTVPTSLLNFVLDSITLWHLFQYSLYVSFFLCWLMPVFSSRQEYNFRWVLFYTSL